MLRITESLAIPDSEIEETFIQASGPGGQKVNKTASAVQLRFDVGRSASLEDAVRQRLIKLAGRRVTSDGVLVIKAQRFRSQERNREDARSRLASLILKALAPPRPRKATKPSAATKAERLEKKRRRGALKRLRGAPSNTEH